MQTDIVLLQERLDELEKEIEETILRVPAHSPKPAVMMDLFALEDERDELLKKLELQLERSPF